MMVDYQSKYTILLCLALFCISKCRAMDVQPEVDKKFMQRRLKAIVYDFLNYPAVTLEELNIVEKILLIKKTLNYLDWDLYAPLLIYCKCKCVRQNCCQEARKILATSNNKGILFLKKLMYYNEIIIASDGTISSRCKKFICHIAATLL